MEIGHEDRALISLSLHLLAHACKQSEAPGVGMSWFVYEHTL